MLLADVHSHILYGVDDGAKNRAVMFRMLDNAYSNGVRAICVTPHYNPELFDYNPKGEDIAFEELLEYSKKKYPDLRLYRWNEVYVFAGVPSFISENIGGFIADNNKSLIEFPVNISFQDIRDTVSGIVSLGFQAVLAHVERYKKLTVKNIMQLRLMGAVITVNAESLIGKTTWREKRVTRKLVKYGLVNIVSSDAHVPGAYDSFAEAYRFVLDKYGEEAADLLFWSNANNLFIKETE